ncbi:MAG: sulfatase-like hydrolase/transferase [Planctomycetaceae bacterium]|nr:sulfatase-like hydrolase/transferase [Planctomycetaceae bacterium]
MRRLFLFCLLILVLAPRAALKAAKDRPNILLIYTDDQSHRTVGCYPESYDFVRTPHIDALAKRGVRFTHAYIGTWCLPSRATLLTGHHPYGVKSLRMAGKYPGSTYDPKQCPFWPSVFRKNGYTTAQIGKWHTGTDTGFGRDWDYQVVWNRPRHVENSGNYFYDQLIEINGQKAKVVKGYSTDNYTRWAQEFIRGANRQQDKPWYLWLCYGAVHGPFTPAKRHLDLYPNLRVPTPKDIYPPRAGKPDYMQKIQYWVKDANGRPEMKGGQFGGQTVAGARGIHGNTLSDWVRQYHQGVRGLDESVGTLIETLKASGQLENTLVVFTSDQGFGWGQHGFCRKIAPYDGTIRSPLIISMPGTIPEGAVCRHPVGGVDLVPTFFSFAGLELPWSMHGHDLTPLLKTPGGRWNHPTLATYNQRKYGADTDTIPPNSSAIDPGGVPWWVSLARGRFKYIRTLEKDQVEELYDLKNDPDELQNLALDPRHARRLARFRSATVEELKRTRAGMVNNLPPVKQLRR